MPDAVLTRDGPISVPLDYQVPQSGELVPLTVRAVMDGTSAAGPFFAVVQVLSPSGRVMGNYITSSIAAGASADVTWFPDLGGSAASSSGILPIIDFVGFNPAGNLVAVTSTDPNNPTNIVTSSSITFDGSTTVWIQFYASAIDLDQRGFTGQAAILLELYIDNNPIGIIGDWNASPGSYFITSLYVSGFDTPSAGSHTYSIKGWRQVQTGSGPGAGNVYGDQIQTSHGTRAGFLVLLKA